MSMSLVSLAFLLTFNIIKSRENSENSKESKEKGSLDDNSDEELDNDTNVSFG